MLDCSGMRIYSNINDMVQLLPAHSLTHISPPSRPAAVRARNSALQTGNGKGSKAGARLSRCHPVTSPRDERWRRFARYLPSRELSHERQRLQHVRTYKCALACSRPPVSLRWLHVLDAHLQHAVCHAIMTQRSVICVCSDGSHGVRRIRGNVQGAAADVTARSVRVAHGAGTSQKTKRCLQLGIVAWTRPQTCGNAHAPTLLACLPSCVTAQLPASAAGAASLHSIICQQMPPPLIVLRILINV